MDNEPSPPRVQILKVGAYQVGQRIDNFLLARLKGVPKSRIYRIIRKGEVRVNRKRVRPEYKLALEDAVRIPPLRLGREKEVQAPSPQLEALVREAVLFEDDELLILNKPSGLPVHVGTGVRTGLIEALRHIRPEAGFLELVHRLDKGTSGCLMVAKSAPALKAVGERLKKREVVKRYHAIVQGRWPAELHEIDLPLQRGEPQGGERFVHASGEGKSALTRFRVLRSLGAWTLVEASPVTGRTHQIRVHAQSAGHPIAGDEKYSEAEARRALRRLGVNRLCLHAASLELPRTGGDVLKVEAPYDARFAEAVRILAAAGD
jgi:23S rRNA pseudouridine955/2504/2580 synthase